MGPLLFALALQGPLETIAAQHPDSRPIAYADDTSLQGTPEHVIAAFETLTAEGAKIGLKARPDKCVAFSKSSRALARSVAERDPFPSRVGTAEQTIRGDRNRVQARCQVTAVHLESHGLQRRAQLLGRCSGFHVVGAETIDKMRQIDRRLHVHAPVEMCDDGRGDVADDARSAR